MNSNSYFAALKKKINANVAETLGDEVFEVVRDVELEHIQEDVYDAYPKPAVYNRRRQYEGLLDPDNIEMDKVVQRGNEASLTIRNTTEANPYIYYENEKGMLVSEYSINAGLPLAPIIENGGPYDFPDGPNNEKYAVPRPFIANTKDDLEDKGQHIDAMRQGLKKRGLNVE